MFEIRPPLCAGEFAPAVDCWLGASRVGGWLLRTKLLSASPRAGLFPGRAFSAFSQNDDPSADSAQSVIRSGVFGYPSDGFAWNTDADFLFLYNHFSLVHGPGSRSHHSAREHQCSSQTLHKLFVSEHQRYFGHNFRLDEVRETKLMLIIIYVHQWKDLVQTQPTSPYEGKVGLVEFCARDVQLLPVT